MSIDDKFDLDSIDLNATEEDSNLSSDTATDTEENNDQITDTQAILDTTDLVDDGEGGITATLTTDTPNRPVATNKVVKKIIKIEDQKAAAPTEARQVVIDVFTQTGMKITEDDPMVLVMLHNAKILKDAEADLSSNIARLLGQLSDDVKDKHSEGLTEFNNRIKYLENILNKLEDQKSAIVQDVWTKSQDIMYDRTLKTMQKSVDQLMKTSSDKVNNERSILLGALGGIIFGLILGVIFAAFT